MFCSILVQFLQQHNCFCMIEKPIEEIVADTILQKKMTVEIGGEIYEVAPPSTATLILVSKEIAKLPTIEVNNDTDILTETLRIAKDCSFLGDIVAILILGANRITEEKRVVKKRCFGLINDVSDITVNRQKELADLLLRHKSPKELNELTAHLLSSMEIGDFFGLTTSLLKVNLTKPTKEVGTTVSGQ